ncbi:hypothetical protein [Kitasatospora sp. NPDC058046]|uniref:hypothetical protein n=1 Tax=Kitasatospora sp. NPDC058046 TaxID=3346312 RepID=UPI0036D95444
MGWDYRVIGVDDGPMWPFELLHVLDETRARGWERVRTGVDVALKVTTTYTDPMRPRYSLVLYRPDDREA